MASLFEDLSNALLARSLLHASDLGPQAFGGLRGGVPGRPRAIQASPKERAPTYGKT